MVVIQFLYFDFPRNLVALGVVFKSNREIATLVELPERSWLGWSLFESTSFWRLFHYGVFQS